MLKLTQTEKNARQKARDDQLLRDADFLVDLKMLPFEKSEDLKELRRAKDRWYRMSLDDPETAIKRLRQLV